MMKYRSQTMGGFLSKGLIRIMFLYLKETKIIRTSCKVKGSMGSKNNMVFFEPIDIKWGFGVGFYGFFPGCSW